MVGFWFVPKTMVPSQLRVLPPDVFFYANRYTNPFLKVAYAYSAHVFIPNVYVSSRKNVDGEGGKEIKARCFNSKALEG